MSHLLSSLRVALATMLVCVLGYTLLILSFAQAVTPATAQGSLIEGPDGSIIGSRLIAQGFTQAHYLWPRPSAVDYNAAGAGGSNLSPANPALAERAEGLIAAHGSVSETNPIPADLVTASGAGLDPHISLDGALFQAERVAAARGVEVGRVRDLIGRLAAEPGGPFTSDPIVNVLEVNLALDAEIPHDAASDGSLD
ncbi:MAG: potassium-transporting ATPase subunit C [Parvularcula sp.]|jgi:K+-transporting ATPase ATPase C chain|nr:potassium-transporting ATPase subunit C [Parvularcula sp.]